MPDPFCPGHYRAEYRGYRAVLVLPIPPDHVPTCPNGPYRIRSYKYRLRHGNFNYTYNNIINMKIPLGTTHLRSGLKKRYGGTTLGFHML